MSSPSSRFFWKAFFRYGELLHVRPAFLPVFGDAPRARGYASTHASQYQQIRRWAWGATDVPYVAVRMLGHPEIPWRLRARRFRYLMFNHLTWATLPLLLLFGGLLPTEIDLDYSLSPEATVLSLVAAGILTDHPAQHPGADQRRPGDVPAPARVGLVAPPLRQAPALPLAGGRGGALGDPGAGGADPAHVRRLHRVQGHGEGRLTIT